MQYFAYEILFKYDVFKISVAGCRETNQQELRYVQRYNLLAGIH